MEFLSANFVAFVSISYISLLFLIAYAGDRSKRVYSPGVRALIYSLSLGVYCSSWTFFGAAGSAVTGGWQYFAIYIGPILLFLLGHRLIRRIITISKQYNITSISDFLASRYGKSQRVAIAVTLIATIGALPYISLQLEAVNLAFTTMITWNNPGQDSIITTLNQWADSALITAFLLSVFSILFGTRHLDTTEHHRGLINAIAFESVVKLLAIVVIAILAVVVLFRLGNQTDILLPKTPNALLDSKVTGQTSTYFWTEFFTRAFLSVVAILLLPRQFQVMTVEAEGQHQINTARWVFPLYLTLFSVAIIPIAIAGSQLFTPAINADVYVLMLPFAEGKPLLALFAYVGGLSAATGMVIVATISISTMLSNDILVPLWLRIRRKNLLNQTNMSRLILRIRRVTIVLLLFASYGFLKLIVSQHSLANMGLLSFAAIAQLAPAFFAGLYWHQANQRGAFVGIVLGFTAWVYCLLIPNLVGSATIDLWFADLPFLHPEHLFGSMSLSPLANGVFWSLLINTVGVLFGSLSYQPNPLDRIQASIFRHTRTDNQPKHGGTSPRVASIGEARRLTDNIIGVAKSNQLFASIQARGETISDNEPISRSVVEEIERAIAAVIGTSSARHIIVTQLLGDSVSAEDLFVMMDKTSQALEFSQELLQASFNNINQAISVIDNHQKVVAWNQQYLEMFRLPEGFLYVGMPVEEVYRETLKLSSHDMNQLENIIRRRLRSFRHNETYSAETSLKDGRHLKATGNPIEGVGFITSYTDITEQKRSEFELLQREERIRLYTDHLPLMLCYVDRDLRVRFSNKAYNRFLGKTADEVKDQLVFTLLSKSNFGEREHYIQRALSGEAMQLRTKVTEEGQTTYYQINYYPDYYPDNSVAGFFSVSQDITAQVVSADLLRQTNEDLENRVKTRTQELETLNQKLVNEVDTTLKLSEEVKAVTRSKTRFLAAASHDLLQPINAARLFNNSLIERERAQKLDASEVNLSILEKVDSSLVNADKLLRALLDISKLDTGNLTADVAVIQIQPIFDAMATELTPSAQQKGLDITFMPCRALIESDAALLRSIIQNLITNAIRYTRRGRILVGCRRKDNHIDIEVWDTGVGIREADQEKIFGEFQRLSEAQTAENDQGLGLGLAITQRLSQILNHPISIESTHGRGSVFRVRVPRHDGEFVADFITETPAVSAKSFSGLRVLVLENTPSVLEAMAHLLALWQCTVLTASDYESAVEHHKNADFDVVMADYRLDGEETGLDFLNYLDEEERIFSAIVVTAEQDNSLKAISRDYGYHFLEKPVDPHQLKQILLQISGLSIHKRKKP